MAVTAAEEIAEAAAFVTVLSAGWVLLARDATRRGAALAPRTSSATTRRPGRGSGNSGC